MAGWPYAQPALAHQHAPLLAAAALVLVTLVTAVVLAKLLLVDRQHLGNLLGIMSFIAYGLL